MIRLYQKSQLGFTLFWIAVYCTLQSLAGPLNQWIGVDWSANFFFCLIQIFVLLRFLSGHDLKTYYGLCKSSVPARRFLYYIPLIVLASGNLWNGADLHHAPIMVIFRIATMVCVGFLEELLFRGFLFRALLKDSVKTAVIISSLTFGLGHILNLVNGSGMTLVENLRQIAYACAVGFLFVSVYYRSGSLLPCIITHASINSLATFANTRGVRAEQDLVHLLILISITLGYAVYINIRQKGVVFPAPEADRPAGCSTFSSQP